MDILKQLEQLQKEMERQKENYAKAIQQAKVSSPEAAKMIEDGYKKVIAGEMTPEYARELIKKISQVTGMGSDLEQQFMQFTQKMENIKQN